MTSSEQMALARRIADEHRGTGFDRYEEAVLAAIIETTELAASWINCANGLPTHDYEPGFNEVAGLLAFAHLKGPTHDE